MKLSHTYLKSSDIQTKINNNLTTHTSNKSIPPTISTQKIHNRTKFMKAKACMERKTQHNMIRKKKIRPNNNNKAAISAGVTLAY
jgi:hypothetical protein